MLLFIDTRHPGMFIYMYFRLPAVTELHLKKCSIEVAAASFFCFAFFFLFSVLHAILDYWFIYLLYSQTLFIRTVWDQGVPKKCQFFKYAYY